MEIRSLAVVSKCSPAALWRVLCCYVLLAMTLSLFATTAARAENLALDPAFVNSPQFHQKAWPSRVTSGPSGKVYVTFVNGGALSGVNNQRVGAVIRLNANGTLDQSFNVGAQFADAWAVIEQTDGRVLIGGLDSNESFDSGLPLYRVFRLNNNGTRDTSYRSPVFTGIPRYMTLQADGKLLVANQGGSANGGLDGLQRLNSDGSLDTSFLSPALPADSSFFSNIVVDVTGRILVGGTFASIAGQPRPGVARLLGNGTLDSTFVPSGFTTNAGAQIRGIAMQTQGTNAGKVVIAGGQLWTTTGSQSPCPPPSPTTNSGGSLSCPLLRLNSDGSLDTSFVLAGRSATGVISARPRMLGILPDDRLLIVSSGVARFNADGSLDSTYHKPVFSLETFWMDTLADGRTYVPLAAGSNVNGSAASQQVMRINSDGTVDAGFAPGTFQRETYPDDLAMLPGGQFLTWGNFDTVGEAARIGAARFNADGTLDNSYSISGISNLLGISSAAALSDGRLLASIYTGTDPVNAFAPAIVRFTAGGAVDTSFTPDSTVVSAQSDAAFGIRLQPDGTALVWALSPQRLIDGTGLFFKRLTLSGSLDATFAATFPALGTVFRDATNAITSVTVGDFRILGLYPDGRMIAAATKGPYAQNATSFNYTLFRLDPSGAVDATFSAPGVTVDAIQSFTATSPQYALASVNGSPFSGVLPQADGKVIVYGSFTALGGQTAPGIARLTSTGAPDSTFSVGTGAALRGMPGRTAQVTRVTIDANGKYWISGSFDTFAGQSAPGLVRLNANGSVDSSFATPLTFRDYVGGNTRVIFDSANRPVVLGPYLPSADGFPDAFHRLVSQQLDLAASWNLVGNGYNAPINVASAFGNSANVISVWKWIASTGKWAFYSPTLGDGGAGYAAGHGYAFLSTINPGEGFWLNAKQAFSVPLSGNPVPTSTFSDGTANALPSGWSLIAIGDNKTPAAFANAIAGSPPAAGAKVATSLATLWAWDPKLAGWYFFAPSLVNAGTQSAYIASQKYLDFGATNKTLTPTTGFWVNRP